VNLDSEVVLFRVDRDWPWWAGYLVSAAAVGGLADTLDEMLTEGFSRLAVGDDERHG